MELIRPRLLSEGSAWHITSLSAVYLSQGLSGGTLFALTTYLVSIGASVTDISLLLSITMIPWTLKVFLGPIIDSFTFSRFGRRRFWVLISQIAMIIAVLPMVFIEVTEVNLILISLLTAHNAFVAVSDIAIDALAADSLKEDQLGNANGFMWGSKTLGRGIGMALATSIFFTYGVNWGYLILIIMMSLTFLFPLFSNELTHKAGFDGQSYQDRLSISDLIKGISLSILNRNAAAAIIFMLFSNIAYGIFDVIYNEFYMKVLGWTGEEIGLLRPIGMWIGGLIGLAAGVLSLYLGKRPLLIFFLSSQILLFFILGSFSFETSRLLASSVLIGIDAFDAGFMVLIFSILMALCVTQTSATNFGIFMGFGNISALIGNNLAPVVLGSGNYSFAFFCAGISLIPCLLCAYYLTRSN